MARPPLLLLALAGLLSALAVGGALTIAPDALGAQVAGRWGQALGESAGAVACLLCARPGRRSRRARASSRSPTRWT